MFSSYDDGHPLVWIGVGFVWIALCLPLLNRREIWAVIVIAIGLIPIVRGVWIAWRSR